jgi:hypothetical protein
MQMGDWKLMGDLVVRHFKGASKVETPSALPTPFQNGQRVIFCTLMTGLLSLAPATQSFALPPETVTAASNQATFHPVVDEQTRINLEPARRDMARMGLERKFYEDLQKEVAFQYDTIKERLPGITYSSWQNLTSKSLNAIHRMHEYHKAMGVYRASLKRAAVIGTFVSYSVIPAMVGGLTGNPAASAAAATIPWEIPIIPIWIKVEITKQRLWLRWKLWGPKPGDWKLDELEGLRREILEVDPSNQIFSAIFETMEKEARNYSFNVVKKLNDAQGNSIAFNAVTYQELEDIVKYAKDGPKFLFDLQSKRGPYPLYAALLLRIIDEDEEARKQLKSLLVVRVPTEAKHTYKAQFSRLEVLRAELNSVSWEIVERMNKLNKGLPMADRPEGFSDLVKNESNATQNIFRHILLLEHRYLLEIHEGRSSDLNPFLQEIRDVLSYQNRFLAELNLPFRGNREYREFSEKVMAWKRRFPGPEMKGMDCEGYLQKGFKGLANFFQNYQPLGY